MSPESVLTDWLTPVLALLVLTLFVWKLNAKPAHFPPGPARVPLLGSSTVIGFLSTLPHQVFTSLANRYGNVVGLYLFGLPVVVLRDYNSIRDAFSRIEFSGREQTFVIQQRSFFMGNGIIFGQGSSWRRHRKFALQQLHSQGVERARMAEALVRREVQELLTSLRERSNSGDVEVSDTFSISSCNVVLQVTAGKRFLLDDPDITQLVRETEKVMRLAAPGNILSLVPWTRFVAPGATGHRDLIEVRDKTCAMFGRMINEIRQAREPGQPARNYVEAFLDEMKTDDAEERGFTQRHLEIIMLDFFQAGIETVNSTLSWACLMLATHPDVQIKIQTEIDTLKGDEQLVWDDRQQLPYLQAAINEVHRFGTVANVSVPHFTSFQATSLGGYVIPQNALVLPDIYHVHHDPAYWREPHQFRPERFLSSSGELIHDPRLLTFGTGRRQCLGESLAKMEVFLFLGGLLQAFRLELPPGEPAPDLTPQAGVTYKPRPFHLRMRPRTGPKCNGTELNGVRPRSNYRTQTQLQRDLM